MRRRDEIERELTSTADPRVLRWLGLVGIMVDYRMARRRTGTRETEVKLDGWCECGLRQQMNDAGSCATMRERSERVPWCICN